MAGKTQRHIPLVWLAPMSGATDAPFRRQAVRFGAKAVVSEMTASEQLVLARPDVLRRVCRHDPGSPWIVQLAGRNPKHMEDGARLLAETGVDQVDINMGCPARKVTGGLSGSALMQHPELAKEIIAATVAGAGNVPVSLKMRLGWDHSLLNAPLIAEAAEALGVVLLTVHGRTRCQFYKGTADWVRIRDTVDAVALPVIANGDIGNVRDAENALKASGADAVMIGRAAMGKPWLPAKIEAQLKGETYKDPDLGIRLSSLIEHLRDAAELYGEKLGVRVTRKHVSAALATAPLNLSDQARREIRGAICRIDDLETVMAALTDVFGQPSMEREAA
ncbi:MAG: tRNA dihydrouridine synthase DusB [Pseudomonadota bacterium]